eukprot:COSAG01_NODE_17209_length_1170_cov_0.785247_2_plen_232_part_01
MWGTCLGFQTVAILAAGNQSLLSRFAGVDGASLPLNFTAAAKTSRLFGHAPPRVLETLGSTPSTVNLHHFGVSPEAFAENPALSRGACVGWLWWLLLLRSVGAHPPKRCQSAWHVLVLAFWLFPDGAVPWAASVLRDRSRIEERTASHRPVPVQCSRRSPLTRTPMDRCSSRPSRLVSSRFTLRSTTPSAPSGNGGRPRLSTWRSTTVRTSAAVLDWNLYRINFSSIFGPSF